MGVNQTRKLEHVDFFLTVKNGFERSVSFDLLLVLQLVLFDILPNFLGTSVLGSGEDPTIFASASSG